MNLLCCNNPKSASKCRCLSSFEVTCSPAHSCSLGGCMPGSFALRIKKLAAQSGTCLERQNPNLPTGNILSFCGHRSFVSAVANWHEDKALMVNLHTLWQQTMLKKKYCKSLQKFSTWVKPLLLMWKSKQDKILGGKKAQRRC